MATLVQNAMNFVVFFLSLSLSRSLALSLSLSLSLCLVYISKKTPRTYLIGGDLNLASVPGAHCNRSVAYRPCEVVRVCQQKDPETPKPPNYGIYLKLS